MEPYEASRVLVASLTRPLAQPMVRIPVDKARVDPVDPVRLQRHTRVSKHKDWLWPKLARQGISSSVHKHLLRSEPVDHRLLGAQGCRPAPVLEADDHSGPTRSLW